MAAIRTNLLFSIPMVVGILAGIAFPYQSLSLVWSSSFLLALLLMLNAAEATPAAALASLRSAPVLSALLLFLLFGALPAVQTAMAAFLLQDSAYVFGVAAASLAPPALVVPLFLKRNGGDSALGLSLVVAGTLLCPLLMVPMLGLFGVNQGYLDTRALFMASLPLTLLPVACGLAIPRLAPAALPVLRRLAPALNALLLGLLLFILVGSSVPRMPLRHWWNGDLPWLLAIMLWMDFGVYAAAKLSLGETAAILLSARNLAIPASLLLFFDPRAALPAAVGLVVHAAFFQWLMVKRTRAQFG